MSRPCSPAARAPLRQALPRRRFLGQVGLRLFPLFLLGACGATDRAAGPCIAENIVIDSTFHTYSDAGVRVAAFGLHQLFASYPPGCSHPVGGEVDLVITSEALAPLAFSYALRGYDNDAVRVWSYDGEVARIAPGDSIVVGAVANSRVRVDVNTRVAFTALMVVP